MGHPDCEAATTLRPSRSPSTPPTESVGDIINRKLTKVGPDAEKIPPIGGTVSVQTWQVDPSVVLMDD